MCVYVCVCVCMFFSSGNDCHLGKKNRLPTESSSYCSTIDSGKGESLLPNSNSPIKSPPYSNAESDDNSFKGTGIKKRQKSHFNIRYTLYIINFNRMLFYSVV